MKWAGLANDSRLRVETRMFKSFDLGFGEMLHLHWYSVSSRCMCRISEVDN